MQFGCQGINPGDVVAALAALATPLTLLSKPTTPSDDDNKCELVGTFSLLTQALLGLLCLSSLIVKRYYEYPIRRTWPVWSFDVSKQIIGAMGIHVVNVLISIVKTQKDSVFGLSNEPQDLDGDDLDENPCDWYFLNIVFDCTIGVYVLYLVFSGANHVCRKYFKLTQMESGQYGPDPHKPSARAYFKQLSVYFVCLMVTKVIIYFIVDLFEEPLLWFTSHILLIWLDDYPDEFEIFLVMFIVPIMMNTLQLLLVDNFIQNQLVHQINHKRHHGESGPFVQDEEEQSEILGEAVRKSPTYGSTKP